MKYQYLSETVTVKKVSEDGKQGVFEIEGLKPIKIEKREGLAIINGTSAMSGIAAINLIK